MNSARHRSRLVLVGCCVLIACGGEEESAEAPIQRPEDPSLIAGLEGDFDVAIRLVPEPPGVNCPFGGTTIETGPDADGDGVLDDDEVSSSAVVCNGNQASQLVRVDEEPPGANCTNGGTKILVGHDDDHDSALDDGEVDDTSYVCNGSIGSGGILGGSFTITNSLDADLLANYTAITGDLTIRCNGLDAVALPALTSIGGVLRVDNNNTLASLSLPALTAVSSLVVDGNLALTTLSLPALTRAPGGIRVQTNAALVSIALPALTTAGPIVLTGNPLWTSFSVPLLGTASAFALLNNASLPSVSLPNVTGLTSLNVTGNAALTTFTFAKLATVSGEVVISNNAALNSWPLGAFPALTSIGGRFNVFGNNALVRFDMKSLQSAGDFLIGNNSVLATVSMPLFTTVPGMIHFESAPQLRNLNVPVTSVGKLELLDNPALRDVAFPRLATAGSVYLRGSGFTRISGLTSLRTVTSGLTLDNCPNAASDVVFPALTSVGADISVSKLNRAATLSFPVLETVGGNLLTNYDGMLSALAFPLLTRISGSLLVQSNPYVTTLGFGSLRSLGPSLVVQYNERLPQCRVQVLIDQLRAAGWTGSATASSNSSGGACP